MMYHNYLIDITTNKSRRVLYTGMTNDLINRPKQYKEEAMDAKKTFAGKYNCQYFGNDNQYIHHAIEREKEIKGWNRFKKVDLIKEFNPEWRFLNKEIQ